MFVAWIACIMYVCDVDFAFPERFGGGVGGHAGSW